MKFFIIALSLLISGQNQALAHEICRDALVQQKIFGRFMKPFDLEHFKEGSHPTVIGFVQDQASFSLDNNVNIQDMVIKMPNTDVRVPNEYERFSEAVHKIFTFEQQHNPNYKDYYAYITVKQRTVGANQAQRRPGVHGDGFPESLDEEQVPIAHTYVVTDNNPTVFDSQSFDFSDVQHEGEILALMEAQKDEGKSVQGHPYNITYMDPYTVHRSPEFKEGQSFRRTFFRIIFSLQKHNRMGNGYNPLFEYDWMMYPRGSSRAPLYTLKGIDGSGNMAVPARVGTPEAAQRR